MVVTAKRRPRGLDKAGVLKHFGFTKVENEDKELGDCWQTNIKGNNINGYSWFMYKGKNITAHRAAYEVNVGPIPEGKSVNHHCTNRRCIRPAHLYIADKADDQVNRNWNGIKRSKITNHNAEVDERAAAFREQYLKQLNTPGARHALAHTKPRESQR
jgi:hypothetical protein